jgi:hypothetical protein
MKKKIDTSQNDERIRAHLKMLNARLAAEQAAERKLTKDQQKSLKEAHAAMARAVHTLGEFNDVWMSDYAKLKDAYYGISTHFSLGGSK